MVEYKINNSKVLFYEDIKETPIYNFTQFKKYITLDMAINPQPMIPLGYVDETIARISQFLDTNSLDYAKSELLNFRQSVWLRMEGVDIRNLALCTLVHSIDGVENNFKTDSDLGQISEKLSKAKIKVQNEIIEHVKKNFLMN